MNLDEFVKDFTTKFANGNARTAIKVKLLQSGINVFSKRVVQAMRYIDRYIEKKEINLEDLALKFDYTPTITNLDPSKQPSKEILN